MSPLPAVLVEYGETLQSIAHRELGDARKWPILAAANQITERHMMRIGDIIVVGPQPVDIIEPRRIGGGTPWNT